MENTCFRLQRRALTVAASQQKRLKRPKRVAPLVEDHTTITCHATTITLPQSPTSSIEEDTCTTPRPSAQFAALLVTPQSRTLDWL